MAAHPDPAARFNEIIEAARSREECYDVSTLIPQAHLAQMRLFILKTGLEFYCNQDTHGTRREMLRRVYKFNQLGSRLEAVIDSYLVDGKGLFYFRPVKDLYKIYYFTKDQYRAYYDEDGDMEELIIVYKARVKPGLGAAALAFTGEAMPHAQGFADGSQERWIRLDVRKDIITQTVSNQKPDFGELRPQLNSSESVNPLAFVPAVEVFNNRGLSEGSGRSEFGWLAGAILDDEDMRKNIKENLEFFGNPTLVSSRPKHDLVEPEGVDMARRATISSASGFGDGVRRISTRAAAPTGRGMDGKFKIPRVIANVEAADRVGYITPDAVGGDLVQYAAIQAEQIRTALGGVDDLSINSGATAYEVRTLYGRVNATAKRKARDLFDYGLCRLFQMMIVHEEFLFRKSFAVAVGLKEPEPVIEESLDPEKVEEAREKYTKAKAKFDTQLREAMEQVRESGQMPSGVIGLFPDGDTEVAWRHQGEIFEDSKNDILQASIVCRNLQELGVDSLEALKFLFPDKTPEERASMLGGFPFRVAEATQRSIGIFVDLVNAALRTPHPQVPDLPLAADPALDLVPFIHRTIQHLKRELTYGPSYRQFDATVGAPDGLSDADRLRAASGLPTAADRDRAEQRRLRSARYVGVGTWPGLGAAPGAAGMAAGRDDYGATPDFGAGGTLAYDPIAPQFSAAGQLGANPYQLGLAGQLGADASGVAFGSPVPGSAGLLPPGSNATGNRSASSTRRRTSGRNSGRSRRR